MARRSGQTSKNVARKAARLLSNPTTPKSVRFVAASALQQMRRSASRKRRRSLPEEASLEDIQYHLYVLQRIERGRSDVRAGRLIPEDEIEQRLTKWLDA